jgi:hypothetical protein
MPDIQLTLKLTDEQFDRVLGLIINSEVKSMVMLKGISHRRMSARLRNALTKGGFQTDGDVAKFIAHPNWRSDLEKYKDIGLHTVREFEMVYEDLIKIVEEPHASERAQSS